MGKPMSSQQNSRKSVMPFGRLWPDGWTLAALAIVSVVVAPLVAVVWIAFHPTENIWPHLLATVLPRYFTTTLILMAGVGVLTAAMGTGAAWLVTMYHFPGRGWLVHALLFPLALPAYVGAYALVDFLDYAGPLQTAMREAFAWRDSRDYWFPEIRSTWAATLVLSAALYPYGYLLTRQALREQPGGGGCFGGWVCPWRGLRLRRASPWP
jgi:iron(III) transport system permease protein